uniref:ATP-Dependent Lon Protease n=1 Tax=Florenciella sp. virus SA2 TaxID=3240092 RepID=A0AB39JBZ2_9VIRU
MYNIETKGYGINEKVIICNEYLIPKLEKELNMDKNSIVIEEDVIKYIVDKFTNEEKGVRNLKRCLEIIFSKVNLYYLMGSDKKLFGDEIINDISFPYTITKEIVDKIVIKTENNLSHLNMYM